MNGAGIMNLPTNVGGMASQDGLDSFAPLIASQQAARDIGYPQFTKELLEAGSEVDSAEVQEFIQAIREARLTPDEIAMMRRVVETVLNDPNNYPQVRMRLLQEGISEDLLPETFDLEFFMAMRIAVEEAENLSREPGPMGPQMPMEMAEGGIAGLPQMQPIARELAAMGRSGDTMLAHITPEEAMMLRQMGGSGTINPYTGLPEFFLKKIGRALKKFAKSTVGRIVIGVALGAFLGPMAVGALSSAGVTLGTAAQFGLSAGIGTFGASLLAGDGLKNSLRKGITAGVTSYVGSGLVGDAGFSGTVPEGTPKTFGEGFTRGVEQITAPFKAAAEMVRPAAPAPAPASLASPAVSPVASVPSATQFGGMPPPPAAVPGAPAPSSPFPAGQVPLRPVGDPFVDAVESAGMQTPASAGLRSTPAAPKTFGERISDFYSERLSPTRASIQGRSADTIFNDLVTTKGLPKTAETMKLAQDMATKEAPGVFAKYGPLAATGALALEATTGGISNLFKPVEGEGGISLEEYNKQRAEEAAAFRQTRPEFFGGFVRGAFDRMPYTAARGSSPEGVTNFPRKTGAINGPGTGTSDSIPAMLSDGEFVFTAKSVRNMGNGSRRKGAAKMYRLMKMLEGGPVGKGR
jgi:hypothetical protein